MGEGILEPAIQEPAFEVFDGIRPDGLRHLDEVEAGAGFVDEIRY